MKVRISQPVDHDGKALRVGDSADLPDDQARALIDAGAAMEPADFTKAEAERKKREEEAGEETDEDVQAAAKAWADIQEELSVLRAKALAYDSLPDEARRGPTAPPPAPVISTPNGPRSLTPSTRK